jgi:hypothetical protein
MRHWMPGPIKILFSLTFSNFHDLITFSGILLNVKFLLFVFVFDANCINNS